MSDATERYRSLVNQALSKQMETYASAAPVLADAMRYSLLSGGKRIRPILLMAACEMGGGHAEETLAYAVGLEMIHSYSCIHDDLPAMDNDVLRRGRPTNHVVYGEAMAILAGDALLTEAGACMLRDAMGRGDLRGVQAAEAIMRRAGAQGMVTGQVFDMTLEGQPVTKEHVTAIHLHKTADLLTAAVEAGLLLAGAEDAQVQAGIAYGQHLGLAFQQMDDLLDVIGDEKTLGKKTGMDAAEGKQSWVALRGVEGTREDLLYETDEAIKALDVFGERGAYLCQVALDMTQRVR